MAPRVFACFDVALPRACSLHLSFSSSHVKGIDPDVAVARSVTYAMSDYVNCGPALLHETVHRQLMGLEGAEGGLGLGVGVQKNASVTEKARSRNGQLRRFRGTLWSEPAQPIPSQKVPMQSAKAWFMLLIHRRP